MWLIVISMLVIGFLNQFLAGWWYHRKIKRSEKKFVHRAVIKLKNVESISLYAIADSDLDAIKDINRQLEEYLSNADQEPPRPITSDPGTKQT